MTTLPSPSIHFLRRRIIVPTIAVSSCLLAVVAFGVGAQDDPYITFWEAEQFVKTGHIGNINGSALEQSTSIAHVILLALFNEITKIPFPVLAYFIGLISLLGTVLLSARIAARINPKAEIVAAAIVAISFPVLYASTGELETVWASFSLLWFFDATNSFLSEPILRKRSSIAFVFSALLIVTVRPDTMIVATMVILALLMMAALQKTSLAMKLSWLPNINFRRIAIATGVMIAFDLLIATIRMIAFHAIVPHADVTKSGGFSWISQGISYEYHSLPYWVWLPILVFGALGGVWTIRRKLLLGFLMSLGFLSGLVVIMLSRGDWMGGARLLVPYLPTSLIIVAVGISSLPRMRQIGSLTLVVIAECASLILFANGASWVSPHYVQTSPGVLTASPADVGSAFGATWQSNVKTSSRFPWYVSWDFASTRDTVFVENTIPILKRLVNQERAGTKISIASNQAGLIFYTLANRFPGKFNYVDLESIETNTFSHCSGLVPSSSGNQMTLAHWAEVAGTCAPPLPDLYFTNSPPAYTPQLTKYYHVVAEITIQYIRQGIGASIPMSATEYLAQRNGWNP